MQWILLAFSSLLNTREHLHGDLAHTVGNISGHESMREVVTDLQQLQRGQAIKHAAGQLGDLVPIQNPAHREELLGPVALFHHTLFE